jgi:hypothetical protein
VGFYAVALPEILTTLVRVVGLFHPSKSFVDVSVPAVGAVAEEQAETDRNDEYNRHHKSQHRTHYQLMIGLFRSR